MTKNKDKLPMAHNKRRIEVMCFTELEPTGLVSIFQTNKNQTRYCYFIFFSFDHGRGMEIIVAGQAGLALTTPKLSLASKIYTIIILLLIILFFYNEKNRVHRTY